MKLSDFTYELPPERIAQYPVVPRDGSKLLFLPDREEMEHLKFRDLPSLLKKGDLLVVNDSKVIPVRLQGKRSGGGKSEVFLLSPSGTDGAWEALVKPAKKLKPGSMVFFPSGKIIKISEELGEGRALVRPISGENIEDIMHDIGQIPLPPYIGRDAEESDRRHYQTIYAREGTSVAAPTAGLHFTQRVLKAIEERGAETVSIRLDVGPGTFKPVKTEKIEDHVMHTEKCFISEKAADRINAALDAGRRIVAVGTTVTRCLEDQAQRYGSVKPGDYETNIFIFPGFEFKIVSGLLTNFHLPGSTLIMLVSTFAGRERVLAAYAEAVKTGYRFYSYGDAMFLWKKNH